MSKLLKVICDANVVMLPCHCSLPSQEGEGHRNVCVCGRGGVETGRILRSPTALSIKTRMPRGKDRWGRGCYRSGPWPWSQYINTVPKESIPLTSHSCPSDSSPTLYQGQSVEAIETNRKKGIGHPGLGYQIIVATVSVSTSLTLGEANGYYSQMLIPKAEREPRP